MSDVPTTPEDKANRAAEYVLGVLEAEERLAFERELARDAELAHEVAFWQTHFAAFNDDYDPVAPPPALLGRIESRLFGSAESAPRWYDSLLLWRAASAFALLVGVVGITLAVADFDPEPSAPELVAALQPVEGDITAIALYEPQTQALRISLIGEPAGEASDYELWFIADEQTAPVSLGVLTPGAGLPISLDEPVRQSFAQGVALAVSLEPSGGSATGQPTGPILALGAATPI